MSNEELRMLEFFKNFTCLVFGNKKFMTDDFRLIAYVSNNLYTIIIQKNIQIPILLNNHLLHGNLEGYRSISAGGDLRLIFEEREDYIVVVFITLGSRLGNLNIF